MSADRSLVDESPPDLEVDVARDDGPDAIGVEHLVDEIARLAREPLSSAEFHDRLLERAVPAMAAVAGTVWVATEVGLRPEASTPLAEDDPARYRGSDPAHLALLERVAEEDRPRTFPPEVSVEEANGNATEYLVIAAPVVVDGEAVAVVEILQRPGLFPAVLRGQVEFLDALCQLAAEFRTHGELRRLRDQSKTWRSVEGFVERVHGDLDPRKTAYTIANDGRVLVDCDRMTVCLGRKGGVSSVSGVDAVQPRAVALRRLQTLVRNVARSREPLWYLDGSDDLAWELEAPLQAHLEESPARLLAVVPIWEEGTEHRSRPRMLGAIVAERYDADVDRTTFRERVESVARHATPALRNAASYRSIPLLGVNRALGGLLSLFGLKRLPKTLAVIAVVAAIIAALVLVPTDFTIDGRAELQPRERRDVFASTTGVVEQVLVDQGTPVNPGDPVAILHDTELEYEFRRLIGELDTARQRLDGVRVALLATQPNTPESRLRYSQLTSEREALRTRIEGLEDQEKILEKRRAELTVTSAIEGRVLTWDTRDTLLGRPVDVGQPLLTVARSEGDWVVEIHVPDHRIGHVLKARDALEPGERLRVEFVLATEPDITYEGHVERIALAGEFDGEESTVLVTVAIDRDAIAELRPGATVVPRIHCGRRSVWYVWTHEIWETIRMRLLF